MHLPDFSDWIGRRQVTEDEISLTLVRRAAALVDQDPSALQRGDPLPPHWYSMFFTPNARASQIGHDGHPAKGDFLPPIPLPRRMFVGREVAFLRPIPIGAQARKVSEIASITPKQGRSGQLVFVEVKHAIELDGQPALVERQRVVYREAVQQRDAQAPATAPDPLAGASAWASPYVIEPVSLFRYSALTWNGHRIHYDADYARDQEGYRGCVMNGALTLHLLIDAAMRQAPGKALRNLSARLSSPLFLGDAVQFCGHDLVQDGDAWTMHAAALDPAGRMAAAIDLRFVQEDAAHG